MLDVSMVIASFAFTKGEISLEESLLSLCFNSEVISLILLSLPCLKF